MTFPKIEFENGMVGVVQVVSTTEPDKESCWTQGVLFSKHENDDMPFLSEVTCTEVGESFLGEYCMDYDNNEYVIVVEIGKKIKKSE